MKTPVAKGIPRKLTPANVRCIRKLSASGNSHEKIAEALKLRGVEVSTATVLNVLHRKVYKWVA